MLHCQPGPAVCASVLGKVVKTNEGWELPAGTTVLQQERLC